MAATKFRFLSSFLDRMRCDEIIVRHDTEPAMTYLVDRVKEFRMPRKTTIQPNIRAEHQGVGAVERAHRTLQAEIRALRFDYKARTGEDILPGDVLFAWLARHSAWVVTRFEPRGNSGSTPYEMRNGTAYKSPIVPFAETVMIRIPLDPPGTRKKLDTVGEGHLGWQDGRERCTHRSFPLRHDHRKNSSPPAGRVALPAGGPEAGGLQNLGPRHVAKQVAQYLALFSPHQAGGSRRPVWCAAPRGHGNHV